MSKPSIQKERGTLVHAYPSKLMFGVMRKAFERYGFQPIETPAMENLLTLTGKYEKKAISSFSKFLTTGILSKANADALAAGDSKALISSISKRPCVTI